MRKFFTPPNLLFLVAMLLMGFSAHAEKKTYELVTDPAELMNPLNKFIMVRPGSLYSYGLRNNTAGNAASMMTTKCQYSPAPPNIPNTITLDLDKDYSSGLYILGVFSLQDNGSYKTLYEHRSKTYYSLDKNATTGALKNDYKQVDEMADDPMQQLIVSMDPDSHEVKMTWKYQPDFGVDYQIAFKGPSICKNYKATDIAAGHKNPEVTTNITSAYTYPLFYKDTTPIGAKDPVYEGYEVDGYDVELGKSFSLKDKIFPLMLKYTFTTDDDDIIEIDNETATFTGLKLGTATINFSTEAVENEYNAGSGSFTITVSKITPELHFADQVVYGKYPTGVVWDPVIVTNPSDEAERGVIKYSSSDPEVITINEETGQITPDDVHKGGLVTITATMEETDKYRSGSASYTIIIKDPNGEIETGTSVFDFTTLNPYGFTTTTGLITYETNINEIHTDNVTTIKFEGKYRSWQVRNGVYELRVNNDEASKFTISVPDGYTISAIGMVGTRIGGEYSPAGDSSTEQPEEWGSDVNLTWHAAPGMDITTVEFNNTNVTSYSQISSIWVQYQPAYAEFESADLSFSKVVNDIIWNEEAQINAVNNPNDREISYRIVGLEDDEYTITPSEDAKTLKVLVKKPGFYTLEATSPAGDGFRDGFAIMRLNVYRHLDVYANDVLVEDEHINTAEEVVVTFEVPDLAKVYYRVEDYLNPDRPEEGETADDEDCKPGFSLFEGAIEIGQGVNGKLILYIANYGYSSPLRTILLGNAEELPEPEIIFSDNDSFRIEDNYIIGKGTVKLNFKPVPGYDIYYSLDSSVARARANVAAETDEKTACGGNHEGYTKHDGTDIELNSNHTGFSVFTCNPLTSVHSTPTTYALSIETGVAEIEIETGAAVYYSIDGVQIQAADLVPGVYVRVKDGKRSKVMVK